jgi:hypothetical protein
MPTLLPALPVARAPGACLEDKKKKAKTTGWQPVPQSLGKLWFASGATSANEKPKRPKKEKVKADPVLVAKARELRDRYLEHFNSGLVHGGLPNTKYDVSRQLQARPAALLTDAA